MIDKRKTYAIDIETEAIKDSPLKKLEIKSIQLDNMFLQQMTEVHKELSQKLTEKNLIAFNAPFEQTQLARSGYRV